MDTTWSRRGLLGLGAAGASAALVGLDGSPAAASTGDGGIVGPAAPDGLGATEVTPVPGAVKRLIWLTDFQPLELPTGTQLEYEGGSGRAVVPSGFLLATLDMPVGSQLAQVDVFGFATTGTMGWLVARVIAGSSTGDQVGPSASLTGTATTATITLPPDTILEEEQAFVVQAGTATDRFVRGVVYQYLPPPVQPELTTINPQRVYDSRQGHGKLGDGQERTVSVATSLAGDEVVPTGARGVAITLTVTLTEGANGGFLSAFPAGIAWPGTSSINWFGPNQNLATAVIVALGGDREITLRGGVAPTDVVVDVTGYLV